MASPSGSNRGRLLLVMLLVSSLLLITLDLRGVSVISGIRNGVGTALTPVVKVGNWVVTPFKNIFSDLIHLGRTRSTINDLKEENAKLRAQLVQKKNALGQEQQLKQALDLAGRANWKTVSARVLAQGSTISFTHTVTIDQGSRSGIKQNMTVVNGHGLVGVVRTVFPNSSIVLLASDPSFKIGVRIARNQSIGILSGQGSNSGLLELLDNTAKIKKNDLSQLTLVRNEDIVATLGSAKKPDQVVVAFAAETSADLLTLAEEKLKSKKADFIYVNDVSNGAIFGEERTSGFLIGMDSAPKSFDNVTKFDVAREIVSAIAERLERHG